MRKLLFLILIILPLISCEGEGFSAENIRLFHEAEFTDGVKTSEAMYFSLTLSADDRYELKLTSPDGSLSFTSSLKKDGAYYESEALKITSYSALPEGEYSYSVINERGEEIRGSVVLDYPTPYPASGTDDEMVSSYRAYIGPDLIAEGHDPSTLPEGTDRVTLITTDSRQNRVLTTITI